MFFLRTFRTKPFDDVVYAVENKSVRQLHHRHMYALQAESTVTTLAIEVGMLVVHAAITVVGTDVVLQRAAPVVDDMYQLIDQKNR